MTPRVFSNTTTTTTTNTTTTSTNNNNNNNTSDWYRFEEEKKEKKENNYLNETTQSTYAFSGQTPSSGDKQTNKQTDRQSIYELDDEQQ